MLDKQLFFLLYLMLFLQHIEYKQMCLMMLHRFLLDKMYKKTSPLEHIDLLGKLFWYLKHIYIRLGNWYTLMLLHHSIFHLRSSYKLLHLQPNIFLLDIL